MKEAHGEVRTRPPSVVAAVSALQVPAVTDFMNDVLAYLPNVIVAILIFVVAALVASAVSKGTARVLGETALGKMVATIAPALVMVIAMFMILEQLNIAQQIVEIAFAATMGALALGLALAFGLGGRPVAQSLLEEAYRRGREEQLRHSVMTTPTIPEQTASPLDSPAYSEASSPDRRD